MIFFFLRGCAAVIFVYVFFLPRLSLAEKNSTATLADDEPPPYETIVYEERRETTESTAISSTIETEKFMATGRALVDLIEQTPGAQVRRSGSLGNFSVLSLRGLGADKLRIVLDELPIAQSSLDSVDPSLFPLESLERIEVYRGFAPVRFENPLGGLVRLVSRPPRDHLRLSTHIGFGSENTQTAHLFLSGPFKKIRFSSFVAAEQSKGNYTYYNDTNTAHNLTDDFLDKRQNNHFKHLNARVRFEGDGPAQSTYHAALGGSARAQGVPGPATAPALHTHANNQDASVAIGLNALSAWADTLHIDLATTVLWSARNFYDREQEIGLGIQNTSAELGQWGMNQRTQWQNNAMLATDAALRLTVDQFRQDSTVSGAGTGDININRRRFNFGLGIEEQIDMSAQIRAVPSIRVDMASDADYALNNTLVENQISPRFGARYENGPWIVRANVGRFHRMPTVLERYGDLIVTVANPDLKPELGYSIDTGTSYQAEIFGLNKFMAGLAFFATQAEQLIALTQSSHKFFKAENISKTGILGAEASIVLDAKWWRFDAAYTLTHTDDLTHNPWYRGKQTPGVPLHHLQTGIDMGTQNRFIRYELGFVSKNFLDRSNTQSRPANARHHVSATCALPLEGFELRLSIRNITNVLYQEVPVLGSPHDTGRTYAADFLDYPLPGRTWFASLVWRLT